MLNVTAVVRAIRSMKTEPYISEKSDLQLQFCEVNIDIGSGVLL